MSARRACTVLLPDGRWKYIAAPKAELYDLDTDPGEELNVIDSHRAEANRLAERVAGISGGELSAAAGSLNEEARRRLQALGYVSSSRGDRSGSRRDPKDARDLAAAMALVTSGELRGPELENALGSILQRDPANPQANLRLGHLRIQQNRCVDAEPLLRRAIAEDVPGADAYLGLATCQAMRGEVRPALGSLENARAREPQNAVVLANIGIAFASLRETQRAAAALKDSCAS